VDVNNLTSANSRHQFVNGFSTIALLSKGWVLL